MDKKDCEEMIIKFAKLLASKKWYEGKKAIIEEIVYWAKMVELRK